MSPTPSIRSSRSWRSRRSLTISDAFSHVTGNLVNDGESGIRISGFLPSASPLRRSISEFYPSQPGYFNAAARPLSTEIRSRPPSYYSFGDTSLPPARFKITPREEEGKEELPAYSCAVHREALFDMKMEMSTPFDRAGDRTWRKVYVVVKGTALYIHKPKRVPFFAKAQYYGEGDHVLGFRPGTLVRRYTLQSAEVGMAADYRKRHYVIRLRCENQQFLFSVPSLKDMVTWIEAIGSAIDLSPSLDERSLPRYQTIPRRRRRRRPEQIVSEQESIMRREFPHLLGEAALSRNGTNVSTPLATIRESETLTASREPVNRLIRQESVNSADLRSLAQDADNLLQEDQVADGKPELITVPEEANLRYAKRCMAVLMSDAPRQSDWIIYANKRWKCLWDKREMVEDNGEEVDSPPEYDKIALAY